ncbi:Methionine aminopeptidase 1 [Orchesella cincta]|uniref:Methionine aminopeptidase n=1 Tax=Orchesella cincta TaxID=48709 RepID=A0A1D2MEL0_ORCCI|nr:Methionine aminopeptidase 1 [Orchesella cincta]
MSEVRICETSSCSAPAKLQCPTCIKLGIVEGSFFCSQECFKSSWSEHKVAHKKAKGVNNDHVKCCDHDHDHHYPITNPWPGYKYTGELRPHYPLSSKRPMPERIPKPDYGERDDGRPVSELALRGTSNIKVLTDEEIEGMRVACKLGREVLDEAAKVMLVNTTTDEVDRIVHEACVERDCYPSPLNYYGFPKSCCTSVNEVICHGIPDRRPLVDGDICNVDVTVYHQGFHGDLNETFCVGEKVSTDAKKLVQNTWECLQKAIEQVKPGMKYRDVGNIIQKHAQGSGFSVVRSYCGHGIHRLFHTTPSIPHYAKNKAVGVMKPGHCFTIEPMISEGTWKDEQWPDDWTAVTQDGKLSAQFEETLLVTETGVEILTRRRDNGGRPYFHD